MLKQVIPLGISFTTLFTSSILLANDQEVSNKNSALIEQKPLQLEHPENKGSSLYGDAVEGVLPRKLVKTTYYSDGVIAKKKELERNYKGEFIEHGMCETFYPNGALKGRGFISEGKKQGPWLKVTEQKTIWKGFYDQGKKQGKWQLWDWDDKKLLVSENYKDGQLEGAKQKFNKKGLMLSQEFYVAGKKQGEGTCWYENGTKAEEGNWIHDKKHGSWKFWDEQENLLLESQFNVGLPHGTWKWYNGQKKVIKQESFADGNGTIYQYGITPLENKKNHVLLKEQPLRHGVPHGTQKEYYLSGVLKSESSYVQGKKDGPFKSWYENGQLQAEATYQNDELIGEYKEFHFDLDDEKELKLSKKVVREGLSSKVWEVGYSIEGYKLYESEKENGLENGCYQMFYKDGGLLQTGNFIHGKKHGLWKIFYPSQFLKREEEYILGKKHGSYIEWSEPLIENGKQPTSEKLIEGTYSNDQKQSLWKYWYPNGSLKAQINYEGGLEHGEYLEYWPFIKQTVEKKNKTKSKKIKNSEKAQLKVQGSYLLGERQGAWRSWYQSGKLQAQALFRAGVKEGISEEWLEQEYKGKPALSYHKEYYNGLEEGEWISYFAPNIKEAVQRYHKGKLQGEVKVYYPNGVLESEVHYIDGVKEGAAKYYHPNHKLKNELFYREGQIEGEFKGYYENGNLALRGEYIGGLPTGSWKWYKQSGTEILVKTKFAQGTGTMYEFFPSGYKKMEVDLIDGVPDGKQVIFHPNSDKTWTESFYSKGVLHGLYREFHPNGELLGQVNWNYGKKEGIYTHYYGNGQKQREIPFIQGVAHGHSYQWHDNGKIESEGNYLEGVRNGEWVWYNRYGDKQFSQVYDRGLLTSQSFSEEMEQLAAPKPSP
ncbi:MAG: Tetratricopeptide 1 repeat-containing protein [Chlamydiales bacterium]|nr:Tetratricopeptide 1 repeat-containing protein [Chlamydiales bacterium]